MRRVAGLIILIALAMPPAKAGPTSPRNNARDNAVAAPVQQVPPHKLIAILGRPVIGPMGKPVGRIVDVLVNGDGVPEAAVMEFGGFMGVGSRKIAVRWDTLHFNPGDPKYPIVLDLLPEEIRSAPQFKGENKPAPVVVAPWSEPAAPLPPPSVPTRR